VEYFIVKIYGNILLAVYFVLRFRLSVKTTLKQNVSNEETNMGD